MEQLRESALLLGRHSGPIDQQALKDFSRFKETLSALPEEIANQSLSKIDNEDRLKVLQFLARLAHEKKMLTKQIEPLVSKLLKVASWQETLTAKTAEDAECQNEVPPPPATSDSEPHLHSIRASPPVSQKSLPSNSQAVSHFLPSLQDAASALFGGYLSSSKTSPRVADPAASGSEMGFFTTDPSGSATETTAQDVEPGSSSPLARLTSLATSRNDEWVRMKSETGEIYYWNRRDDSTSWQLPLFTRARWQQETTADGIDYYWNHKGLTVWTLPSLDETSSHQEAEQNSGQISLEVANELAESKDAQHRWMSLRQRLGLFLCPCIVIVCLATQYESSSPLRHRLIGVVCLVAVMFLTEVMPLYLTSMCVGPFLVAFSVCDSDIALAPYANDVCFLLWGTSFLTAAMSRHSLHQRFATWVTNLPMVGGVPWRKRVAIALATVSMSLILNVAAVASIMFPIILAISGAESSAKLADNAFRNGVTGNVLVGLYSSLAGSMATILSPPIIVCISSLQKHGGIEITFLKWLCIGVPAALLVSLAGLITVHRTLPAAAAPSENVKRSPGRWKWGEKVTISVLFLNVALWLFPTVYNGPGAARLRVALPPGVAAVLGTVPLFLIPDVSHREPVLPWKQAVQDTDWGVIMLVGGGMSLGNQIFSTGLAKTLAVEFISVTGINDIYLLTAATTVLTITLTEMLSNLATIAMLCPIILAIAQQINPDPSIAMTPVVAVPMAAMCSFMTPWASAINGMAYGTGHVTLAQMLKFGLVMNMICSVVIFCLVTHLVPLVWPPGSHVLSTSL
jgi:sodium-dependent dicarboxylate transporter 2/3/5